MKIGDLYKDKEDFGLMIVVGFSANNTVALYHPEDNERYEYSEADQVYLVKVKHENER